MNAFRDLLDDAAGQPRRGIDSDDIQRRAGKRRIATRIATGSAVIGILAVGFTVIPGIVEQNRLELGSPTTGHDGGTAEPQGGNSADGADPAAPPQPGSELPEAAVPGVGDGTEAPHTAAPQSPDPQSPPTTSPAPATPYDRTVMLPSHQETMLPDAAIGGILTGDPDVEGGCVWLQTGSQDGAVAMRWPSGYQARFYRTSDGVESFELLDGDNRLVARQGDQVIIGGAFFGERLDRCHVGGGSVWYASSVSVQGA